MKKIKKQTNGKNSSADKKITPVMPQIKTIVMLMLENRSLDNVLGFLYPEGGDLPSSVYPPGSPPTFNGASTTMSNRIQGESSPFCVTNGTIPNGNNSEMQQPDYDPGEKFDDVTIQLYGDESGNLPAGNFWETLPTMQGFAYDYQKVNSHGNCQSIMGAYNPEQLPVINGLAKNFAVSDRWFCSVPTQTFPNRAYSVCGTSLGNLTNSEIDDTTYSRTNTIFNELSNNSEKTWGIYWQSDNGLASGTNENGVVATQWLFPMINSAFGSGSGQISPFNSSEQKDPGTFMGQLELGILPNFCYIEPKWGGGLWPCPFIQGNDYHPSAYVSNGDFDLNTLYEKLKAHKQWEEMLFIITFDEHGGTYDHEPPTQTVNPDGKNGDNNFAFNRLGVRVPTILISPFIPKGLVFRSPQYDSTEALQPDFDHTSFIATILKWAGINPKKANLGKRVQVAPTFENVLSETARDNFPEFTPQPGYSGSCNIDIFNEVPPNDADGNPMKPRPITIQEFREAFDSCKDNPSELSAVFRKLRYGV